MTAGSSAIAAPEAASASALVRVYVWEVPVRVTHWLIALSILVLSVTGFYIGRPFMTVPGTAGDLFVMGWMRIIHLYAAYTFLVALVARLIWMFTGNKYAHWDKFLSVHRTRQKGILPTVFFYLFLRDAPPGYVGHNPVAASAYTLVFGLCALEALTGLILRGASAEVGSIVSWFGALAPLVGGLQVARWIHHVVMWLLLGFAVHHVYSAVLVAMIEKNGTIDSIVSGYKWVPKHEIEPGPYRWMNKGEVDE
jgi:Ni/Fe-hydrogenase 1 B-type cytochrome subunit